MSRNKLLIVGNGFDLTHDLRTKYSDFLIDLLSDYIKDCLTERNSTEVKNLGKLISFRNIGGIDNIKNELLESLDSSEDQLGIIKDVISKNIPRHGNVGFDVKNGLLREVILSNKPNWVDIEQIYFDALQSTYEEAVRSAKHRRGIIKPNVGRIEGINKELDAIESHLSKYLNDEINRKSEKENNIKKKNHINNYFVPPRDAKLIVLNFNYTDTHSMYVTEEMYNVEIINIHGQLNDENNPIIFGLGDENHEYYKIFSESNEDEYLKKVKSIKYLATPHYKKLINLINAHPFDTYILGHSCGISDRTLLSEIFNSDTCYNQSINICHHAGLESYINKVYGISRYFSDNQVMRNKVKEYDPELKM